MSPTLPLHLNVVGVTFQPSKRKVLGLRSRFSISKRGFIRKSHGGQQRWNMFAFLLDRFPGIALATLQDLKNLAEAVMCSLRLPTETVVSEITAIPMRGMS
jgi:hypothetical protein